MPWSRCWSMIFFVGEEYQKPWLFTPKTSSGGSSSTMTWHVYVYLICTWLLAGVSVIEHGTLSSALMLMFKHVIVTLGPRRCTRMLLFCAFLFFSCHVYIIRAVESTTFHRPLYKWLQENHTNPSRQLLPICGRLVFLRQHHMFTHLMLRSLGNWPVFPLPKAPGLYFTQLVCTEDYWWAAKFPRILIPNMLQCSENIHLSPFLLFMWPFSTEIM